MIKDKMETMMTMVETKQATTEHHVATVRTNDEDALFGEISVVLANQASIL